MKEGQLIKALIEAGNLRDDGRLWRNNVGVAVYKEKGRQTRVRYGVGGTGGSDLIGFRMGQFVAIEVKSSKKVAFPPRQKQFLKVVNESGGYGAVCYPENLETVCSDLIKMTNYAIV